MRIRNRSTRMHIGTRWAALILILATMTGLLFQPSWSHPFVLDDMTKIQQNPDLRLAHPGFKDFVYPYESTRANLRNDPSRPLTFFIYYLCWQMGEGSPVPFHLVNTVIHFLVALALAVLTVTLMQEFLLAGAFVGGALSASLFLTAPLLAGSVFYAYALSDLLAALFVLLALLGRRRFYVMALFFALALASKQTAVAFPATVLVLDWFQGAGRRISERWRAHAGLLLVVGLYLGLRAWYLGGIGDLEAQGTPGVLEYALSQGGMILRYLFMLVVPIGFTIDHFIRPEQLSFELEILQWLLVLLVTALALAQGLRRQSGGVSKWLALSWLVFLILLLPVSSFFPTVDLFVERRAYLPSIGVALALGGGLAHLLMQVSRRLRIGAMLVAALALTVNLWSTTQRRQVYSSKEKLWEESLRRYPLSPRAHLNLATAWAEAHRYDEARVLLERLQTLQPENGVIYSKLGFIFAQEGYAGRSDQIAWEYYRKSFELLPDDVVALLNAGALLMHMGNFTQASATLLHAVELSPGMAYAHFLAGQALFHANKKSEAASHFQKVLALEPANVEAAKYLAALKGT